jgi:hypothetical protein
LFFEESTEVVLAVDFEFSFSEMYAVDYLIFSPFLRNFMGSVQIFFSQLVFHILYTCTVILRKPPQGSERVLTAQKREVGKWKMEAVPPFSKMVQRACPCRDLPLLL